MRRRQFLGVLGAAVALRPLADAFAQQAQQKRRIGVLVGLAPTEDAPSAQAFITPFRESMQSAGWIEGDNIEIEYRYGGSLFALSKTKKTAAALVTPKPDVILSPDFSSTLSVRRI